MTLGQRSLSSCLDGRQPKDGSFEQARSRESEHLFKILPPGLEHRLFLGASHEQLFERSESLRSLIDADTTNSGWGSVGRFGWKYTC
jgi:hypothetical protein